MNNFIGAIKKSLESNNNYAALFICLAIPDICGKIEYPKVNSSNRYISWFEEYMPKYSDFLSGDDCYALRCSLFHEGSDNIEDQGIRKVLDHYVFLNSGPRYSLVKDCVFNGQKRSFLQLNVQKFCGDICFGLESWIRDMGSNEDVKKRMENLIKIHDAGYVYGDRAIKFG